MGHLFQVVRPGSRIMKNSEGRLISLSFHSPTWPFIHIFFILIPTESDHCLAFSLSNTLVTLLIWLWLMKIPTQKLLILLLSLTLIKACTKLLALSYFDKHITKLSVWLCLWWCWICILLVYFPHQGSRIWSRSTRSNWSIRFLIIKCINGEKATYNTGVFSAKRERTFQVGHQDTKHLKIRNMTKIFQVLLEEIHSQYGREESKPLRWPFWPFSSWFVFLFSFGSAEKS